MFQARVLKAGHSLFYTAKNIALGLFFDMASSFKRFLSFLAGIILFACFRWLHPSWLSPEAASTLAIGALMITWWITELMPMPVVALLPLILFPALGITPMKEVAPAYANPVIFLFLGGFMIGLAIEKWKLHQRIALGIMRITGTSGNHIILGFIISSGFISMWLSNTATTMMMYPIAMSVIAVMEGHRSATGNLTHFNVAVMLSIAYASNFGGIATIIGTPPNVAYVAFLEQHNQYTFSFAEWMLLCTPLSILLMAMLYLMLVHVLYPNRIKHSEVAGQMIRTNLQKLGPLSVAEKRVLTIFILTALLWITRDLVNSARIGIQLNDTMIALMAAVAFFIVPSGTEKGTMLLHWQDTKKMTWGILLLFGGGIALAGQLEKAGLIEILGRGIGDYASEGLLLLVVVTLVSVFLSELMSNVAQVIVLAPVVAGITESVNGNALQLGLAMTLGASCAGMLPMGTPPNAIVFASGRLKLRYMTTTGFVMNIVSAALIVLFCWHLVPRLISPLMP